MEVAGANAVDWPQLPLPVSPLPGEGTTPWAAGPMLAHGGLTPLVTTTTHPASNCELEVDTLPLVAADAPDTPMIVAGMLPTTIGTTAADALPLVAADAPTTPVIAALPAAITELPQTDDESIIPATTARPTIASMFNTSLPLILPHPVDAIPAGQARPRRQRVASQRAARAPAKAPHNGALHEGSLQASSLP